MRVFLAGGINQQVADLVPPTYTPVLNPWNYSLSGHAQIDPATISPSALLVVFLGQSTNSNSVLPTGYTPGHAGDVFNLSIAHKGATFAVGSLPLLSCDIVSEHWGKWLADALVGGGVVPQVVLAPAAFGGSYAADWAPGGGPCGGAEGTGTWRAGLLSAQIGLVERCICNAGLDNLRTVIIWNQGQWDGDSPNTSQSQYLANGQKMIAECKRVNLLRPGRRLFVDQCARITSATAGYLAVRAAQAALVDGVSVFAGIDFDAVVPYSGGYQSDLTHCNWTGAAAQAAAYVPLVSGCIGVLY